MGAARVWFRFYFYSTLCLVFIFYFMICLFFFLVINYHGSFRGLMDKEDVDQMQELNLFGV